MVNKKVLGLIATGLMATHLVTVVDISQEMMGGNKLYAQEEAIGSVTVVPVNERSAVIEGTSIGDATISLVFPQTGEEVTTTANELGYWSLSVPESYSLAEGESLSLTVHSPEGSIETKEIVVEASTEEEKPEVIEHFVKIDSVTVEDGFVSGTSSPNATVSVRLPQTGEEPVTQADEEGKWMIAAPETYDFQVQEILEATATSTDSQVEKDQIAVEEEDAAEDHYLEMDPITPNDSVITGQTSPQATVTFFLNATGEKVTVEADEEGKFSAPLPDGYEWTVGEIVHGSSTSVDLETATDEERVIEEEAEHFVTLDPIYVNESSVSGTSLPGSTITVQFKATGDKVTVEVDAEGSWSVEVPESYEWSVGDLIQATATSPDLEIVTTEATVQSEQVEHFISIDDIQAGDRLITGNSSPHATITLMFVKTGDKVTVDANEKGYWEVAIPEDIELLDGDQINATATAEDLSVAYQEAFVEDQVTSESTTTTVTFPSDHSALPNTGEKAQWLLLPATLLGILGIGILSIHRK
ncbi:hypothetical protein [Facklamia lactis]|uniref:hypothetical protein n=1 Tax=Facklamia lactis TaxID=2749967 RepID=UPI0018CD3C39|nr:hypothetical protein [Facklamia lactis]MBG9981230.1 hypothetical protein [Facklamia lactis]